jgi:hypothetical protein
MSEVQCRTARERDGTNHRAHDRAGGGGAPYTGAMSAARAWGARVLPLLTAAWLAAWPAWPAWPAARQTAPAAAPAPPVRAIEAYEGVRYVELRETAPRPLRLHVARVDLRAPGVRIRVSGPGGGRETRRETTHEFLRREGAQLGVNGHFFLPFPSDEVDAWAIGFAVSDGVVYSAFETPEQRYALVPDAPALHVDRRNRARIVHRAPRSDGRTTRERIAPWNAVAGSAQIVTRGRVTIPRYRTPAEPDAPLVPGPEGRYDQGRSWYDVVTARTAIGRSRDGRTLVLAVAERSPSSDGSTVADLARRLIRDFGVWDALNLDGGGSSTMAWQDPATGEYAVLNTPSDGPDGRRVATSVAVFARPRMPRR